MRLLIILVRLREQPLDILEDFQERAAISAAPKTQLELARLQDPTQSILVLEVHKLGD